MARPSPDDDAAVAAVDDGERPASHCPVAILGAGLTGMAAAHRLDELGIAHRLIEREPQPGGLAVTVEERGYRFDRTGHLLHVDDEQIRSLALRFIGPEVRQIGRRAAVWSHGVYTRYPFQANLHGLPPKVAYQCLLGFLEARERQLQPGATRERPRDFAEYCLRHFGRGITEHFMVPYNSRLWGVPPTEITADWCSRFVPVPTLEDVIAGAVGLADRELGYNARFFYPRKGIGQLSTGLASEVGAIELGRSPTAVRAAARELVFDDERISYDVLLSTIPLPRLIGLCQLAPDDVHQAATKLRATPLHYLDVALRVPCGQPYHWVYVPEAAYPFYRVGCYSNLSADMAPVGKACLYVELADRGEPDLPQLLPTVAAGLTEMGMIRSAADIVFARARRIDCAYVIFDHSYFDALGVIEPFLSQHHIISRGRYGGWNYSAMADAIRFGRDAADEARRLLAGEPPRGSP
ncbi:MAG: NAD(P)-binding protein [Deltaproteobacteria bacterium]|jgi:protoporphyrinogen oxidase|nr:NAD(P)-binding protein [Deltaproteobacteria bacterium]MBW2531868.1 NAD(P)-binding protein [Deltaproteobacteria bacterium]